MDWNKVIEVNRAAISQIMNEIFALLELVLAGKVSELPRALQIKVRRLLRPTEAAIRRLIVIMAADVKVNLPPTRAMPKGLIFSASKSGALRFKLFVARKQFPANTGAKDKGGPRVHIFGAAPLIPSFPPPATVVKRDASQVTAQLCRRFSTVKLALENLPREAKRLVRWRLRRSSMKNPKFVSPLRPGKPPGHQQHPSLPVDHILQMLHGLAFDVLRESPS